MHTPLKILCLRYTLVKMCLHPLTVYCWSRYALFALRELRLNPGSIYDSWQQPGQPCRFQDYQSCFNISAMELAQWVREEGLNPAAHEEAKVL